MAHGSFLIQMSHPAPGGRGTGLRAEYATLGGGEAVSCRVLGAAREYEGGAKTVKAAGDGGLPLTPCPLERWREGVKACVRF